MSIKKFGAFSAATILLGGCGSIPDVTVKYYFPHAKTQFAVTQTIGCGPKADGKHRIIRSVFSVAPTTTNSADLTWLNKDGTPYQGELAYKSFRSTLSDADASVTLTTDGRLSAVNATSTGEGSAIIQDVVTVAGAVATLEPNKAGPFKENSDDLACDQVDNFSAVPAAAGDKPTTLVTLTYSVAVLYNVLRDKNPTISVDTTTSLGYDNQSGPQQTITLVPDAGSQPAFKALQTILAERMSSTLTMVSKSNTFHYQDSISPTVVSGTDEFPLVLNKVAVVDLRIDGYAGDLKSSSRLWAGSVAVPTRETYQLAIPSPVTFGKTAFGLQLSDSGAVTQLHYGSNTGGPDAANAVGAIAKALQPASAEDQATVLKGQADLIVQQQRLIRCQVSPTACT